MKIAINATSTKMGGAVSYLTNLLHYLPPPESAHRFFVFLPADTAKLLPDVRGNISLYAIASKNTGGWRRLWWEQVTLRRFLRRENIEALFSTANFAMLGCPVKQVLLVRNALYFSKMYKQMFLGKHGLRYRLAFGLRRWMIFQSVRSADVVMTPTQAMLDDVARSVKLDRRKALVNYYGADMPPCPCPPRERGWTAANAFSSRGESGEVVSPPKPLAVGHNAGQDTCAPYAAGQPGVIRLTYVSLYSEHKNLSTLLRAMPLLNRNGAGKFLLKTTVDPAWGGAAWTVTHKDDLALARQPDVAPWVEFSGPPQTEQVEELYRQCDVFVFPSLCESFGHPMAEAMVHGLPIVASDTPVNREICGDAGIYFSPLRPEDAAQQIAQLAADDDLRAKLSAEGRRRAETQFNWSEHVRGLLDALEPKAGSR